MHILVADDDAEFRRAFALHLAHHGHEVIEVTSAADALARVRSEAFDLVVADVRMPPIGGFTLLRRMRAESPETPIALMTSFPTVEDVVCAMQSGAVDYLVKPPDDDALEELLHALAAGSPRHRTVTARHQPGTSDPQEGAEESA